MSFPGNSINNAAGINQVSVGTPPATKDSASVLEAGMKVQVQNAYVV